MNEPTEVVSETQHTEKSILALVEKAGAGDEKAFGSLIEIFAPRVQAMIYRMILDWDETRDVSQETFVSAWQALSRSRPEGKFQSWLFRIGARKALDVIRRRCRHPEARVSRTAEQSDAIENRGIRDVTVERNELQMAIEKAVAGLPEEQRVAFVLAEYEGHGHREIAEVIGGSAKRAEMQLYRARSTLRDKLKRFVAES